MHSHVRRLLIAVLPLLVFGVAPVLASEASDRAALEAAAQGWVKAFNARDANALVALATADVVLLDPNLAPVSGQAAARTAWQRAVAVAQGQVTAATKEIVIAGDVAWRLGALTHTLPNAAVASRGQSLEIWKRVNGSWKIHRQMSSSILAPPQLPRPPLSEPVLDAPRN